jgi:hypothetical protein
MAIGFAARGLVFLDTRINPGKPVIPVMVSAHGEQWLKSFLRPPVSTYP